MARKYTRDNRGRFASVGATARGGRLKTAGGGKRQTQTMRAQAPGLRSNTIAKGGNGVRGSVARSLAAVKKNRRVADVKPVGKMKPLRGVGVAVKGNLKGFKGLPVSIRTRSEASAAYKERIRRTREFAMSAPGMSREWQGGPRSITVKKVKVNQGNLLTGRTERVTTNIKTKQSDQSRIGQSAASRKTQQRRDRAEARYEALIAERKSIMGQGRVKSGVLAKNSQRMAAVSGAFRAYDMGTGRKPAKRRTGRR